MQRVASYPEVRRRKGLVHIACTRASFSMIAGCISIVSCRWMISRWIYMYDDIRIPSFGVPPCMCVECVPGSYSKGLGTRLCSGWWVGQAAIFVKTTLLCKLPVSGSNNFLWFWVSGAMCFPSKTLSSLVAICNSSLVPKRELWKEFCSQTSKWNATRKLPDWDGIVSVIHISLFCVHLWLYEEMSMCVVRVHTRTWSTFCM